MFAFEVSYLTVVINFANQGANSFVELDGVRHNFSGTGHLLARVRTPGVYPMRIFRDGSDPEPWNQNVTLPGSSGWPLRVAGAGLPAGEFPADPNVARVLHTAGPFADMILSTQIFGNAHILAGTVIPVSGWNPPN